MTTTTLPTTTLPGGAGTSRILAVTKLHFVNVWTVFVVPAMITAAILLANVAIWAIVLANGSSEADRADMREGFGYSGASTWIFVYMMVVAVQAINITFPFALGYGVTRRDFYLGSALAFTAMAAGWAVLLTVLSYIEQATDGWWVGGRMFSAIYFGEGDWYQRLFLFFVGFLFFFFVGAAVATLYVRWKANGLLAFFAVFVALLIGAAALITTTASWPAVGAWFVANGPYGVAAWLLLPAVVAAVAGFFVLRRATPKG